MAYTTIAAATTLSLSTSLEKPSAESTFETRLKAALEHARRLTEMHAPGALMLPLPGRLLKNYKQLRLVSGESPLQPPLSATVLRIPTPANLACMTFKALDAPTQARALLSTYCTYSQSLPIW